MRRRRREVVHNPVIRQRQLRDEKIDRDRMIREESEGEEKDKDIRRSESEQKDKDRPEIVI